MGSRGVGRAGPLRLGSVLGAARSREPERADRLVTVGLLLSEVTLVWVLFADASRVRLRDLRGDLGLYTRLLAVGLPLTIAAGALLAMWLFDGMGVWLALLIGAALAPTDAALGAAVMTDPAVPERIRRILNVESGLNDGIATPVVAVAIAAPPLRRAPRARAQAAR
jgi:NhaP-type Na+/H+ or K+/H+ antiporter